MCVHDYGIQFFFRRYNHEPHKLWNLKPNEILSPFSNVKYFVSIQCKFDFISDILPLLSLQDSDDIYSKSYIPGTLTKHKFETLGTRDAVKESRQNYLSNQKKEQGTDLMCV